MGNDKIDTTTVPVGAPAWVTPELLEETISTWQVHYGGPMTPDEALDIVLNTVRLFDAFHNAKTLEDEF